jgi:CubicO group peptidase (beta-lactamase class C family)
MIQPGFERVEQVFREVTAQQGGGGLAFAAEVAGEPVVDLVGGVARPGQPWGHDTRAVVMSVTKGWAAMCLGILFDRGTLGIDMPVGEVWPEFGANGKDRITVRQILDHTNGVLGLPGSASIVQWDGGGWDDLDAITSALASSPTAWEPGTRRGYHAVTFGWLAGELVRRADGRTLGSFFHDEIAGPLGLRTAIGVPVEDQGDVAALLTEGLASAPLLLRSVLAKASVAMRDPGTLIGQAFLGDGTRSIMDAVDDLVVDGRFLAAEVPASNGVSSAADLAHLYAPLANGGGVGGVPLFGPTSLDLFLRPAGPALDSVMAEVVTTPIIRSIARKQMTTVLTVGGFMANGKVGRRRRYGPHDRTVANEGAGGQVAFADPIDHVSAGFVRTALSHDTKAHQALIRSLYECLGARRPSPTQEAPR